MKCILDECFRTWPHLRQIKLPAPRSPQIIFVESLSLVLKRNALDAFAARNSVSSAIVIYTVWALLLEEYIGSRMVGMQASVSGRNLDYPSIELAVGSLIGRCPLIVELKTNELTVKETLLSVQSEFARVHGMQWTYPESENHIPQGKSAYSLDSFILVLLGMPVEPGEWKVIEFRELQCHLWLGIAEKNGTLNIRLRHDVQRYAASAVHSLAHAFIAGLEKMVGCDGCHLVIHVSKQIARVTHQES